MDNLTSNEVFTLVWIVKKIRAEVEIYPFEQDSVYKQVRKKAILELLRITNEDNDGLLEAVFLTHFQEYDFQWSDVVAPNIFEMSIG
jgi:hypothetical protein